MTAIGIDFGTSTTVVAAWTPDGIDVLSMDEPLGEWEQLGFDRVMPSVFATLDDERAAFGWAAKRAPRNRIEAVKRLFATQAETVTDDDGRLFWVDEVVTMLFAEMRLRAGSQGLDVEKAVVTIPANSRGAARYRTRVCAGMGAVRPLALINEPTAAAMAYCMRHPGDQQLLVFDWGGGTLDVTILNSSSGHFREQASMGLPTRGGVDFDVRLRRAVLDAAGVGVGATTEGWTLEDHRRFDVDVELAKIKLSDQEEVTLQLPGGRTHQVTRALLDNATAALVDEARRPIERCLRDIGAGPEAIDAVVMVGGTSRVPAVRRLVAEVLDREPAEGIDPLTAVGEGAAVASAILSGELWDNGFFVCTEHALGVVAHDPRRHALIFSPIIGRNHLLPAESTETYYASTPDQEEIVLKLVEGDPDRAVDHPDNVVMKHWTVRLPEAPEPDGAGRHPTTRSINVAYRYDTDGIVHVTVTDGATGATVLEDQVSYVGGLDDVTKMRISLKAQRAVETGDIEADAATPAATDPVAQKLLRLAARASHSLSRAGEPVRAETVEQAAEALVAASSAELGVRRAELRALLAPYPFLDDEGVLGDEVG